MCFRLRAGCRKVVVENPDWLVVYVQVVIHKTLNISRAGSPWILCTCGASDYVCKRLAVTYGEHYGTDWIPEYERSRTSPSDEN